MRTSAVIRIVVGVILVVFLVGVLYNGINGNKFFSLKSINISNLGYSYEDSEKYSVAEETIKASDINELDINWTAGNVNIILNDKDEVEFYEESTKTLQDDEKLRYYISNGELKIHYMKSGIKFKLNNNTLRKTLTIKVPKNLTDININVVSANIDIKDINVKTLDVDNVSGDITLANTIATVLSINNVSGTIEANGNINKFEVDTISGKASLTGSVEEVEVDTTSGSIHINSNICPNEIDINSISGTINITIPDNYGFIAKYNTVSGDFNCDFQASSSKNKAVYKNGNSEFEFNTTSGDININKK